MKPTVRCPRCRLAMVRAERERGRPYKCVGCRERPEDCLCAPAIVSLTAFGQAAQIEEMLRHRVVP